MKNTRSATVTPLLSSITFFIAAAALTQIVGCAHQAKFDRRPNQVRDDTEIFPENVSSEPDGDDQHPVSIEFPCQLRDSHTYFFCFAPGETTSGLREISPGTFVDGDTRSFDYSVIHGFSFANDQGPNAIVTVGRSDDPADWSGPARSFEFRFQGRNRRNIHVRLFDNPSEKGSDQRETRLVLAPRKVLPSIRLTEDGLNHEVTLPTGETVLFSAETHEVRGGVFSEKPLSMAAYAKSRALFPGVQYTGDHVAITVSARGRAGGMKGDIAQVTKKGHKTCSIDATLLWTKQNQDYSFHFGDDESLDKFLIKMCGISLY